MLVHTPPLFHPQLEKRKKEKEGKKKEEEKKEPVCLLWLVRSSLCVGPFCSSVFLFNCLLDVVLALSSVRISVNGHIDRKGSFGVSK